MPLWVGKSPRELLLEWFGTTSEAGRRGDVNGLAVDIGVVAVFVGGIVKLIRFRLGECDGRGEPSSNRVGLCDFGELTAFSGVGLSMDSLDNRSTRVNFASPREDDCGCCVRGEFWGELNEGTD